MEEQIRILNEQISLLTYRAGGNRKWCLSLHGGGPSTKETAGYLAASFSEKNISFSSFDFSGQGKSSGLLGDSSLERRFNEAVGVIDHLGFTPKILIGTSMGGYIAMKVTEKINIENLILFCPAAYSEYAWNLRFGYGFTEEIRRENSFLKTDVEELCRAFRGNVLLAYGSDDNVVPLAIQDLYENSFVNAASFKKVTLQGCPHHIHRWLQDKSETKGKLIHEIDEFVRICNLL